MRFLQGFSAVFGHFQQQFSAIQVFGFAFPLLRDRLRERSLLLDVDVSFSRFLPRPEDSERSEPLSFSAAFSSGELLDDFSLRLIFFRAARSLSRERSRFTFLRFDFLSLGLGLPFFFLLFSFLSLRFFFLLYSIQ